MPVFYSTNPHCFADISITSIYYNHQTSTFLMSAIMFSTLNLMHRETADFTSQSSSMAAAAFLGIAWFICIELNIRLFCRATRRSLYFWSCLLCSWGLMIHGISILLANFNKWTAYSSIVVIHFSWLAFVVAQSFVLYSRLGLVWKNPEKIRYVLYMIAINSAIFGLVTVLLGMMAARLLSQATVLY
jgi:hypothetical protein